MQQHDLTIACTVDLPKNAVLSDNKQTFTLDGKEFLLNSITFSPMKDDSKSTLLVDLAIQDVEETSFNLVEVSTDVPLTIREKMIIAIFYVEDGFTYRIISRMLEEGFFYVSADGDEDGEEYMIHLDSIPSDAYFLGATRL